VAKLEIDTDIADKITLLNLMSYRRGLKAELKHYNPGDFTMHAEDVAYNIKLISALDVVIKAFDDGVAR
jgi:hypothetical protein